MVYVDDNVSSFDDLINIYDKNPQTGFIERISKLYDGYSGFRKVKGDGNCFYRSLLFSYLELLVLNNTDPICINEIDRISLVIMESKRDLLNFGFEEFVFEPFVDLFEELLVHLRDSKFSTQFYSVLEENMDSYTWFLRLLTSVSIRMNSDEYIAFIFESGIADIDQFCKLEVEPMGKECDHLQISALSRYLGLSIDIVYLNGSSNESSVITIGDPLSKFNKISLLYRPGHYDILYVK